MWGSAPCLDYWQQARGRGAATHFKANSKPRQGPLAQPGPACGLPPGGPQGLGFGPQSCPSLPRVTTKPRAAKKNNNKAQAGLPSTRQAGRPPPPRPVNRPVNRPPNPPDNARPHQGPAPGLRYSLLQPAGPCAVSASPHLTACTHAQVATTTVRCGGHSHSAMWCYV